MKRKLWIESHGQKTGTRAGVRPSSGLLALGLFLALFFVSPTPVESSDVTVSATIEPAAVAVGEQATLTVSVEGKFRKSGGPQLPPLDDIDVYDAGSSQNFSIVNGAISASVSFTYVLVPKKEGTFEIAPIRFTVKDKVYTANPVTLEVVEGRSSLGTIPSQQPRTGRVDESVRGKNLFIQADVDKDTVYVNQQITWRLGFYTDGRVRLTQSPHSDPPEAEGFWVEDLPPLNKYHTTIDDTRYTVSEIKRGYFPTAPGEYTIGGASVRIVIDDFGSSSMDDFFRRPFRSFGFGKPRTLTTKPIKITVLPLPRNGKPRGFTGIVGSEISLDLRANKQVTQVGEPVTVTLKIEGKGNVKTITAPKLQETSDFKVYESGSSSKVFKRNYIVSGRKTYEYVFIPKVEGEKIIPPVRISYFDPLENRYKLAQSPSIHLEVKPGVQEEGRRIVFAGGEDQIEVLARDIHYIHPVPSVLTVNPSRFYESRVFAVLHVVPLLAIFLSFAVERRNRRWRDNIQLARSEKAARDARKKLDAAEIFLKKGNVEQLFSMVSEALWSYMADKMNASSSGLTMETVSAYLRSMRVAEDNISGLEGILNVCDAAKYSAGTLETSPARETLDNARRIIKTLEKEYLR